MVVVVLIKIPLSRFECLTEVANINLNISEKKLGIVFGILLSHSLYIIMIVFKL